MVGLFLFFSPTRVQVFVLFSIDLLFSFFILIIEENIALFVFEEEKCSELVYGFSWLRRILYSV